MDVGEKLAASQARQQGTLVIRSTTLRPSPASWGKNDPWTQGAEWYEEPLRRWRPWSFVGRFAFCEKSVVLWEMVSPFRKSHMVRVWQSIFSVPRYYARQNVPSIWRDHFEEMCDKSNSCLTLHLPYLRKNICIYRCNQMRDYLWFEPESFRICS